MPLSEVFRNFQIALLSEGADWVPYSACGAGPGGYLDVISTPTDAPLEAGDLLMLDTGSMRLGYFCDFHRNWAVGSATQSTRSSYQALVEAVDAGFAAARPGAAAADVFHAHARKVIGEVGDIGLIGAAGARARHAPDGAPVHLRR